MKEEKYLRKKWRELVMPWPFKFVRHLFFGLLVTDIFLLYD